VTRDEIFQALRVTLDFIAAKEGPADLVLIALLRYAAQIALRTLKDGEDVEGFLRTCRTAIEGEIRNRKRGIS
jgi:hypothetical protein